MSCCSMRSCSSCGFAGSEHASGIVSGSAERTGRRSVDGGSERVGYTGRRSRVIAGGGRR